MRRGVLAARAGQRARARRIFSAVLHRKPSHHEAWLELAAVLDDPEEAATHLAYALALQPGNRRARRALKTLRKSSGDRPPPPVTGPPPLPRLRGLAPQPLVPVTVPRGQRRAPGGWLAVVLVPLVLVLLLAFWSGLPQGVLATLLMSPTPVGEAAASEPATAAPFPVTSLPTSAARTPTRQASSPPAPTAIPTTIRAQAEPDLVETQPNPLATPTWNTPALTATGTLVVEASPPPGVVTTALPDLQVTPTPTPTETTVAEATPKKVPADRSESDKWIEIDLSKQRLYAHEGQETVLVAKVSTGTRYYPTVRGRFKIYAKYRSTPMSGPGYYLPGVPWTMYFYGGYAIHGAYWHNNFGHPMSHGCVNMKVNQAKWLYAWAPKGTLVVVHR